VERPELGGEWPVLRKLCVDQALAADDVPDTGLAAAAIQGEQVASFDADFKRLLPKAQLTLLSV
jgi:predicted nucleic acid-binding protein